MWHELKQDVLSTSVFITAESLTRLDLRPKNRRINSASVLLRTIEHTVSKTNLASTLVFQPLRQKKGVALIEL